MQATNGTAGREPLTAEQRFYLLICLLIALTICIVVGSIVGSFAYTNHKAFSEGYEQRLVLGGTAEKVWVKGGGEK